jgi:uncharacterized damage-inducible protein DinB
MNIHDIHLIHEYKYWENKRILAACANASHEQFAALLTEYGHSPEDLDFILFLNDYNQ